MLTDRSENLVRKVVEILAEKRREKELSMNKLAWMSGLSPKAIAFIEQEKNSPTLRNVVRLADALELPILKLFAEAEKLVSEDSGSKTKGKSDRSKKS